MNNKEFTSELAERLGYTIKDTSELMNSLLSSMTQELEEGNVIAIQGFGSFEGVIKTKGELYDFLRKKGNSTIFIHHDNPYLMNIAKGLNLISYGSGEDLYVNGCITGNSPYLALEWKAEKNGEIHRIRTQLIGEYNFPNALAAITIGRFFGVEDRKIDEALAGYTPQNNRSQLKETADNTLIIDAKSGTSGAGRGSKVDSLYCEVNENIKAYGVASHRHTPEIEEQLSYAAGKPVVISFTPHLVPMNRGILVTAYASLTKEVTWEEVRAAYDKYYKDEYFVRVLDKDVVPQTRWVEGSNFADVNFKIDPRTNRIVMMGAIDNMVKGAAGQAIQNMNLMFGLPENTGLKQIPMFP